MYVQVIIVVDNWDSYSRKLNIHNDSQSIVAANKYLIINVCASLRHSDIDEGVVRERQRFRLLESRHQHTTADAAT